MTTLGKVRISFLVRTMSTCQQKELDMVEGNTCTCSCSMWKPTYCVMATKVLQIASWVLVCLLPGAQHKKWIPVRSMGCMNTHRRIPTIERHCSPSHVLNDC
jgi:hypothetical protein